MSGPGPLLWTCSRNARGPGSVRERRRLWVVVEPLLPVAAAGWLIGRLRADAEAGLWTRLRGLLSDDPVTRALEKVTAQAIRVAVESCPGGDSLDEEAVGEVVAVLDLLWPTVQVQTAPGGMLLGRVEAVAAEAMARGVAPVEGLDDTPGTVSSLGDLEDRYGLVLDPEMFGERLARCWGEAVKDAGMRPDSALQGLAAELNAEIGHAKAERIERKVDRLVEGVDRLLDEEVEVPAWLWAPPDEQLIDPPVVSKVALLPLDQLSWASAERLFVQLFARQGEVRWAKLYGTPGQGDEGIDAYARLKMAGADTEGTKEDSLGKAATPARPYAVLQSRRVRKLSPSDIAGAIDDFLAGGWPPETRSFYYATSFDLTDTRLDEALRDASRRLDEVGIEFVPWDVNKVSTLLRSHPDLVDDFFSRAWVEHFCGPEAIDELSSRLPFEQSRRLRTRLAALYEAVFAAQDAIERRSAESARSPAAFADSAEQERFVVLDVVPRPTEALGAAVWVESGLDTATTPASDPSVGAWSGTRQNVAGAAGAAELGDSSSRDLVSASALGRPRRTLRPVRALLDQDPLPIKGPAFHEPADRWLSQGRRNLIVGDPGSGKSSLLRFVARDLLAPAPQSAVLQRAHGGRLPIWMPFGFLCRHLDEAGGNSLVSAIHTWLKARAADDLWPLVKRALDDNRLLLLVDGIDEWNDPGAANRAMDCLETFLGCTHAAAFLTSRPYAIARLTSALTWRRADLAPLNDEQRKQMAAQYLTPGDPGLAATTPHDPSERSDVIVAEASPVWRPSNVEPFLAELARLPELSVLARTPLMLALLATTWQGEPLPPRRYELYRAIVHQLVARHPKMRRRSSNAGDRPLTDDDFTTLIEAVAYRFRSEGLTGPVAIQDMRKVLQDALCDEEVLSYPPHEARRMASAALDMGEGEFGLLVPQGAGHVGFVHRVVRDQLAGQRLGKLAITDQVEVFNARNGDPAWTDVLLSALKEQRNPPTVADLLDRVLAAAVRPEWPEIVLGDQSAHQLLANALAADVGLSPRKVSEYLHLVIHEVDSSPSLEHRASLITALVKACAKPSLRPHLLPTFKRWLDATRPFPSPALSTLHDLPIPDARAALLLVRGMRSDSGEARANAATAYAHRFGHPKDPIPASHRARRPKRHGSIETKTGTEAGSSLPPDQARNGVIELICQGPTSGTQAAGLLALGLGWPDEQQTHEHLEWGRRQLRASIRTTALYLTVQAQPGAQIRDIVDSGEIEWIMRALYEESWLPEHTWTAMTYQLVEQAVAESEGTERAEIADLVLDTLRTNGATGGNRHLSWSLACRVLADDDRLRDWVIAELTNDRDRPLILYNLDLIPEQWRQHPAMTEALAIYVSNEITDVFGSAVQLASSLPPAQAREGLLKGLDAFRPWSAARRLFDNFGEDPEVRAELFARLADDNQAGRFSSLALDLLGVEAGFERIYTLLVASLQSGAALRGEDQVLLAESVATAWRRIRDIVDSRDGASPGPDQNRPAVASDDDVAQSRRVLATFQEEDICSVCMEVSTSGLGWHIADMIYTWPDLTVDYAIDALSDDRHVTEGIDDTIHSVVLRAHTERPCPDSLRVLDLALDLMRFLEPGLREVLVHELCLSDLTPAELLDVLSGWKNDKDNGVRRTAAVGITRALARAETLRRASGATVEIPELEQWRSSVRADLCSYGPSMDENRQNAWVSMLLLGDLDLIGGLRETIGEATEPGIRLTDIHGNPDELLVDLVAQNWAQLSEHFGENLLPRLSHSHGNPKEAPKRILDTVQALAHAADKNPDVAQVVHQYVAGADDDEASRASGQIRGDLRWAPPVIDWRKREGGGDRNTLEQVLRAGDDASTHIGPDVDRVTRWALTQLLDIDSWTIDIDEFRACVGGGLEPYEWSNPDAWQDPHTSVRRSAWALLYPNDAQTQQWLDALCEWFHDRTRSDAQPASWLEVCALTFGASAPDDMPVLAERLFTPERVEYLDDSLWKLTTPLLHRLRHELAAVVSLQGSLDGGPITRSTPLFAPDGPNKTSSMTAGRAQSERDSTGRRIFITALALKTAGHLGPDHLDAAVRTLRQADPRLVVADPFTNHAGPLWVLGAELLGG